MALFLTLLLMQLSDEQDRQQIEHVYNTYHDDMVRIARKRLWQAGSCNLEKDTEDAVQEAFFRIVKYRERLGSNKTEKELKLYIFTVLQNVISALLSEEKDVAFLQNSVENILDLENFVDQLDYREKYDQTMNAIRRLPEIYKRTFVMRFSDDMSPQEIAAAMDVSVNTVYSRIARGRVLLRKAIEEGGDDCG